MAPSFGRGAMTNNWVDISNSDLVFVMGGNPAENHPCGFKWAIKAREKRGAKIIVVDPRFTRTAAVADIYVQIRPGTDIAFLGGIINYLLQNEKYNKKYVLLYTNASYIIKESFSFKDGVFSGFDPEKKKYDTSLWDYEIDEKTKMAKTDPELKHPRCVLNILKEFYSRYTPEVVEQITGCPKEKFLQVAEEVAKCAAPDKNMTILYALGWTHHSFGTQNIRTAAILQLLLGNIGVAGGGINALRGHANVQGMTDLAGQNKVLPGYLKAPTPELQSLKDYLEKNTPKPLNPKSMNYWSNYPKFIISFLKCMWGDYAQPENDYAYHYLYKVEGGYNSWGKVLDDLIKGKIEGVVLHGCNVLANSPNAKKTARGLAKAKWMVILDPFMTESAEFWKLEGQDPASIKTEILLLPTPLFAEKEGSFTNSARWIKWKYKCADPVGDAKDEKWILAKFFIKLRELYEKEGGVFPEPILHLRWPYLNPEYPSAEELLAELNGYALKDMENYKKGQRLRTFADLKDDGSTACGCWIYCGVFPPEGNLAKRTDLSDPLGLGTYPNYAWSWPVNRRVLYNRASCDENGIPWDPKRPILRWDPQAGMWIGDVPDFKPTSPPEEGLGPFIMLPEGVARLFVIKGLADGPLPEHYEPVESPVKNILHPEISHNPVAKVFKSEADPYGDPNKFPYIGITYRVTEHFHWWTKFSYGNSRLISHLFIEIPEELAKEKGIATGDLVKVESARGFIVGLAYVTKRIKSHKVGNKTVYTIGIPIHWGFKGIVQGGLANILPPSVFDPNASTPEYKGFLVNIEKVK